MENMVDLNYYDELYTRDKLHRRSVRSHVYRLHYGDVDYKYNAIVKNEAVKYSVCICYLFLEYFKNLMLMFGIVN